MKKNRNLVVKTNQLNTALQNLSLVEIRIVQLAIVDARETNTGLSTDRPLRISALRYAEMFDTSRQNAYIRMKEAEETLFNRRFSYIDDEGRIVKSRWIQQVRYLDDEGAIEIVFTLAVVKGISRINGAEKFFTSYLLEKTCELTSNYSVRLYELLTQWRSAKVTPVFKLEEFKGQLGLGVEEYKLMSNFKRRVLDLAVREINEYTDLKISYEQKKKGRKIVGFKFKVLEKHKTKKDKVEHKDERNPDNGDMFTINGLSDKQLGRIARHKDFVNTYSNLATGDAGKDWKVFNKFMVNLIKKDPDRFNSKRPIREYLNGKDKDYIYT